MNTYKNNDTKNKELRERYGHFLDKYIDAGGYPDTALSREQEEYIKDVENGRYGHLLDIVTDPVQKIYDRMMGMYDMSLENKKRRAEEKERYEQNVRERIRNKIEKERLHNDRMRSFADGMIERKKAKIEAETAQREKEEREKREERECMERFHHLMDTVEKTKEISARADEIMMRRKKQEEEHKRQMVWFDSQKRR